MKHPDLKTFCEGYWFKDVPKLMSEVDILYTRAGKVKWRSAADRIIEARRWEPTRRIIEPNLEREITRLGVFYVSEVLGPGPCFVFPLRDMGTTAVQRGRVRLDGGSTCIEPEEISRAQLKPCYTMKDDMGKTCKYINIGPKLALGPNWLGNDLETIEQIIKQRRVLIIEGGFDLLACRLLRPDIPSLSPLKKSLGSEHEIYLRMLGVKRGLLMFDNEAPKDGKTLGGGNMSMHTTIDRIKTMKMEMLLSPAGDPSACLESVVKTRALQKVLAEI